MTTVQTFKKLQKGFTLIELLVVMAVIAVLAGIVLAGVNPLQQLARGRDANRVNAVSGLGRSMQNFATVTNGGVYPNYTTVTTPTLTSWQSGMQTSGEIATIVNLPAVTGGATANCPAANMHGTSNVCYLYFAADNVAIWTILESELSKAKASATTTPCATTAGYLWMANQGKAGYVCLATANTLPTATQAMFN